MFRNHIKVAFRGIRRQKAYSAINIIGFAVSLSAFILMALYIENELSFDKFHANSSNIYRVVDDKQTQDIVLHNATTAAPVAPNLKDDFAEVQEYVRLLKSEALVKKEDNLFQERNILFADQGFFKIFSFDLVKGNPTTALSEPMSVVLTQRMSDKYFGDQDPTNQSLSIESNEFKVTGVIQNVPTNSHFNFDFLISMSTAEQRGSGYDWLFTNWYSNRFHSYILLPENYDETILSSKFPEFDQRHRVSSGGTLHHYDLEKLQDIYLFSDRDEQIGKTGNVTNLYIFSFVALFILMIACINFINLSTARGMERAKEVAVKKVAGASRYQMAIQFLSESFIMACLSLLVATILVALVIPYFNIFAGTGLSFDILTLNHLLLLAMLLVVVGGLSGAYPAFTLSSFQPSKALKGKQHISSWDLGIRKGLVVLQFSVSVILIVCSLVVYKQLQFLQQYDLGFQSSQTLVINFEGSHNVQSKREIIKRQLLEIPGVRQVSTSSRVPGDNSSSGWSMNFALPEGDTIKTEIPVYLTDFDFHSQYGIEIIAGRSFSEAFVQDSVSSMIINEATVRKLGFNSPEDALGVNVGMYPSTGMIVGVCKDFNFQSLRKKIEPLALRALPTQLRYFSLELSNQDLSGTIEGIENLWKTNVPQRPLEYYFLDESFNQQYQSERKFGQVFTAFTSLAIVIACLGLFGLALFSVQRRIKEIGTRKVLGASVASITVLLSKDFLKLVLLGAIIASPIAWYLMDKWLLDFAYRINVVWWIFFLAGSLAVVVALLTVSTQAIKAATKNPVEALKCE